MVRHLRLSTLVALFVVISAVAAAAAPFAYVSQSGTSSVFIVDTGTTPPSAAVGIPPIAVPAGRMPWGVALSADGAMLFVTNFAFSGGSVMAFNTSTGALIREVQVGMLPYGVAVNPVSGEVYVTVVVNGTKVIAIHPSTWANLGAPPVMASMLMPSPRGVAVNSAGTIFYVTNFANDMLHVFDGVANADGTHNLIKAIDLTVVPLGEIQGFSPVGVAVSPDGSTVYVANQDSNSVTLVNAADNTIKETVLVGNGPTGVAVSPDGLEVYVTNQWSGTVSFLDANGQPLPPPPPLPPGPNEVAVGVQPFGISTDGLFVYVAVFNGGTITAIDRATWAKTDIPALFPVGFGKFVNPAMKIATVMSLSLSSKSIVLGSAAPVTATATLARKNNGAPVAGASIMFSVNGTSSGTAVTGANGVAEWSFSASELRVGVYTVKAVFSESKIGSNVYTGSEASAAFGVHYAFAWLRPTNGSTTGVTAGSSVPVRWTVTDANGKAISDHSIVTEISSAPCTSGSVTARSARVQAVSAGGSDLRYNTDNFVFNWKTDKAWAGTCREFIVQLNDGSSHSLAFTFK